MHRNCSNPSVDINRSGYIKHKKCAGYNNHRKETHMLGNYLKKYRLDNNLTQTEMAESIGTSQVYYCLLETGAKKPGIQMIRKISKVLEVEPRTIRGWMDEDNQ